MAKFGDNLRIAREKLGLTQQELAKSLYVTRQTVSRWERGDRYPDLIMAKKLAQFLDIGIDELMESSPNNSPSAEAPIIENTVLSNITIALYACIEVSLIASIIDGITRIHFLMLTTPSQTPISVLWMSAIELTGSTIQMIIFGYAIYQSVRHTMSPLKTGIVFITFLLSECISRTDIVIPHIYNHTSYGNIILYMLWGMIPLIICSISVYRIFMCHYTKMLWYLLATISIVIEIIRTLILWLHTYRILDIIFKSGDSPNTFNMSEGYILTMNVYILILYQMFLLHRKRQQ